VEAIIDLVIWQRAVEATLQEQGMSSPQPTVLSVNTSRKSYSFPFDLFGWLVAMISSSQHVKLPPSCIQVNLKYCPNLLFLRKRCNYLNATFKPFICYSQTSRA
jgi:hypothetical protein